MGSGVCAQDYSTVILSSRPYEQEEALEQAPELGLALEQASGIIVCGEAPCQFDVRFRHWTFIACCISTVTGSSVIPKVKS